MARATVLLSGGVDSTSCIHFLQTRAFEVRAIYVDFGQPAAVIEWAKVVAVSRLFGIPSTKVTCSSDSEFGVGELGGRNAFLLFAAMLLGKCEDGLLVMGIHSGSPYFDCSPEFVDMVARLVSACSSDRLQVHMPFLSWTKADVYAYFRSTGINPQLTYSCEAGTDSPCGDCLSCRDRRLL
ncbi:7-cyano-7-deazaguanine synthase [Peteryoungia ipomoeae]|nr:7-cyano-7-deazaguanine synthase [Peteryoungia ipomoeae]